MPQSVLDLGLEPTKRAKGQAYRRLKKSESQRKVQTANQLDSAQQLQLFLAPPSSQYTKPLGLQEIGQIFDQETQRMWDIDLRQRGLADGIETRDKLSRLHHELFRVNQCKILDQYWRRSGQRISQKAGAREIARRDFKMEIYKRCKEWFESKNSTTYLNSHTELGSAQLQLRRISEIPLSTVCFSHDEGVSCAQSQFGRTSVRPRDTVFFNNNEGVSCVHCFAQCWAQSPLGRTSASLPDTVDPGCYEEVSSGQLQLGRTSVRPPDMGCLSSDKGVSCAQLELRRTFERPPDTNNSDTPVSPTFAHCQFPPPIQNTGQGQNLYTYIGQETTSGYNCDQIFSS